MAAKKNLNFTDWLKLQEVGTSTACVATFSRMVIPMQRRIFTIGPGEDGEDSFFKTAEKSKKKKKKKD